MDMTIEKYALLHFKHRHAFESTDFYRCKIVPLINRAWKKYFVRVYGNLEAIIDIGWFHLDRRLLKYPFIFKTKIRLDNNQLDNQHDPPLQTHRPIPEIINTGNLTIVSDITPPPLIFHHYSPLIWIHPKEQLVNLLLTTSKWSATTIKWNISTSQE